MSVPHLAEWLGADVCPRRDIRVTIGMSLREHELTGATTNEDYQAKDGSPSEGEEVGAERAIRYYRELERRVRGELAGAEALWQIAELYSGGFRAGGRPLGEDGWERAIAVYEELIAEYPDTEQADWAAWRIAQCHGVWARSPHWYSQCGKAAWRQAIELYWELYELYDGEAYRAEALRRIAEIEAWCLAELEAGIRKYRMLCTEFREVPENGLWLWNLGVGRGTLAEGIEEDMIAGIDQLLRGCTSRRQVRGIRRRLRSLLRDFPPVAFKLEDLAWERLAQVSDAD